ncbi:MAG: MtrB/PioB family outer membrane beta-barrel protein [Nitrospinae bacterium]|nr:MtrB/PioB family outer membrane beta-barrel protein [Nitrospinota bacterium]
MMRTTSTIVIKLCLDRLYFGFFSYSKVSEQTFKTLFVTTGQYIWMARQSRNFQCRVLHPKLHSGEYHYRNNLALGLTYLYENFFIDNWSLDRVNAASSDINQVMLLSDPNPDYQAHVTMI